MTLYQWDKKTHTEEVRGELMVVRPEVAVVWRFNETAAIIWMCFKQPASVVDVTQKLIDKYEVSQKEAEKEIVTA